ncbi:MAG TPA: DUF2971 domain-containing protein [Verrucomicrobiae bacterium]
MSADARAGNQSQPNGLRVYDFKEEEQTKALVWRYLTFEKFMSLLELEAMWFSRLGALQDRYECTPPQGVRAKVLGLVKNRATAEKTLPAPLLDYMEQVVEHGRGDDGRRMGAVNCWFLGNDESERMWREYGQEGRGVAIQSTVRRLATSFEITGDYALVSGVGRIKYVDFESYKMKPPDENNLLRVAFLKDKAYAAEQEIRVVTLNSLHSGCLNLDGTPWSQGQKVFDPNAAGLYMKCSLQNLITRVVVGPNARPYFLTLVRRLVGRYRLFIPVEPSRLTSAAAGK